MNDTLHFHRMIVSVHSNQNQTSWTYPRPCTTSLKQDRLVIRPFFMSEVTNEQASRLRLLVIMFAPINLVDTCPTTLYGQMLELTVHGNNGFPSSQTAAGRLPISRLI